MRQSGGVRGDEESSVSRAARGAPYAVGYISRRVFHGANKQIAFYFSIRNSFCQYRLA